MKGSRPRAAMGTKKGSVRSWRGVIFDMDGLLLDSERLERDACRLVAAERGLKAIDDTFYLKVVGRNGADTQRIFLQEYGADFPYESFRTAWKEQRDELIARDGLPIKLGAVELIDDLRFRGVRLGVATSTGRCRAAQMLIQAGLHDRFDAFAFGDEVMQGKPHPEIFLKVSDALGVAPQHCLVLEDSEAGIEGARAAGMTVIAVPDLKPPSQRTESLTMAICASLVEVRDLLYKADAPLLRCLPAP
jgi:HAD superfamily hydrolase (TIGR01509 family)